MSEVVEPSRKARAIVSYIMHYCDARAGKDGFAHMAKEVDKIINQACKHPPLEVRELELGVFGCNECGELVKPVEFERVPIK